MKPVEFREQTKVLGKPETMTDDECMSLPVWNADKKQCISCWKGTWMDRIQFLLTGKMWVGIYFGETQPPVYLTTDNPLQPVTNEDLDHGN